MPLGVFSLSFFQFCSPFCANFILHEAGEDVRDLCLHDPVVTQEETDSSFLGKTLNFGSNVLLEQIIVGQEDGKLMGCEGLRERENMCVRVCMCACTHIHRNSSIRTLLRKSGFPKEK